MFVWFVSHFVTESLAKCDIAGGHWTKVNFYYFKNGLQHCWTLNGNKCGTIQVECEGRKLLSDVKNTGNDEETAMKGSVAKLQAKFEDVDVVSVTSLCNFSVGYNFMELEHALQKVMSHTSRIKNAAFDQTMFQVRDIFST